MLFHHGSTIVYLCLLPSCHDKIETWDICQIFVPLPVRSVLHRIHARGGGGALLAALARLHPVTPSGCYKGGEEQTAGHWEVSRDPSRRRPQLAPPGAWDHGSGEIAAATKTQHTPPPEATSVSSTSQRSR